ncbi:MAG: TonB-dependent receptor [Candidatus Omnitrophota bacterium]
MKNIVILLITICCLLAFSDVVFGQDNQAFDLDRIVVTASRIAQHDYKITGNVSVITREDIEESSAENIADVLKEELGVSVYNTGTTKTSVVDIRGFGDTATRNVLVLVNDRRVNPIDISGPDLIQIPLEAVDRIEIIRGAGSVLYGDNAVGGVINIITKKGKGPLSGQVGVNYGSYDALSEEAELSGEWKELSYYFYSKYSDTDGYRENSDLLAKDYDMRLGYKIFDMASFDLIAGWHEDDYGLPGGLSFAELEDLGRRGSANAEDRASSKDRHVKLAIDLKPWPEDMDFGHFVVDFFFNNKDTYAWFDYGAFGATATKRSNDTYGLSAKYIFDKTLFSKEFNFVTGIDWYDVTNDILGSGAGISASTDDLTISKEEIGGYLFTEYEILEHGFINGGLRYQKAAYTFDRRDTPFYDEIEPSETVTILGAKYEYAKGSNVHFNVQQTFRFLSTDEWYDTWSGLNTDIDHQNGIQYEIGLKHNFDNKITVSLTPYWMDLKNEIFFNPTSGSFGSNDNYDKTRRVGLETGLEADLLKFMDLPWLSKLKFFANYTYQEPKFSEGAFEKKLIPMAPRHQVSSGLNLELFDRYKLSLIGTYVGSRFAINDTLNETPPIKPYALLDAKIAFDIKHLECFISLNNIFNEQYYTYVVKSAKSTNKDHFPAPEMNFVLGVKGKF